MFEVAALAKADEIVALADRHHRRGIKPAADEQRAVAAENRHGGHLRIAAAHRSHFLVNDRRARTNAVVVEAFRQIDDARVERFVHVEHFQRVFLGDAHGAQRHVGGVGFAGAQVAERHGRDVKARQHDRGDKQRDQSHAPNLKILLRHGGKYRLALPVSGKAARSMRVEPVLCH